MEEARMMQVVKGNSGGSGKKKYGKRNKRGYDEVIFVSEMQSN
jgi:hypothetical protein